MKIALSGSMKFKEKMKNIAKTLRSDGHSIVFPPLDNFRKKENYLKIKRKLMSKYLQKIKEVEGLLVLNYGKKVRRTQKFVKNYVGGSSFLEMGLAFYYDKKIFLLFKIPSNLPYTEEIKALNPIILDGPSNLNKIQQFESS